MKEVIIEPAGLQTYPAPVRVTAVDPIVAQRLAILNEAERSGNISATCLRFGICRQTLYNQYKRLQTEGTDGLQNHSCRPHRSPNTTPADIVEEIQHISWIHPDWGSPRISRWLRANNMTCSHVTVQKYLRGIGRGTRQERGCITSSHRVNYRNKRR